MEGDGYRVEGVHFVVHTNRVVGQMVGPSGDGLEVLIGAHPGG